MRLLVLAHIYFPDNWKYLFDRLQNLKQYSCTFIFNVVNSRYDKQEVVRQIGIYFPEAIIIEAPNHGRDIGGKLAAIEVVLKLKIKSDLTLIIHDKQSAHTPTGIAWRNELFQIIEKNKLPAILSKFRNHSDIGLIGSKNFLVDEYDYPSQRFNSPLDELLRKKIKEMDLNVSDFRFIAGNIFWIRSSLIEQFFLKYPPLVVRSTLEHGNVLDFNKGTHIHSWERIFSWLPNMYQLKISGI